MNYYVYNTNDELGCEPPGTEGRRIFRDCTTKKVYNYIRQLNWTNYSIYSFTNFYDNNTFKLIERK